MSRNIQWCTIKSLQIRGRKKDRSSPKCWIMKDKVLQQRRCFALLNNTSSIFLSLKCSVSFKKKLKFQCVFLPPFMCCMTRSLHIRILKLFCSYEVDKRERAPTSGTRATEQLHKLNKYSNNTAGLQAALKIAVIGERIMPRCNIRRTGEWSYRHCFGHI